MKYSSNFEGAVVEYEPWAEMPVALNIFLLDTVRKCISKCGGIK